MKRWNSEWSFYRARIIVLDIVFFCWDRLQFPIVALLKFVNETLKKRLNTFSSKNTSIAYYSILISYLSSCF